MSNTEQHGPFYIEWSGNIVLIRSKQPFRAQISVPMPSSQQGAMHMTQPIALTEGMLMILSTVGSDDVVIDGKAE